MTSSVTNLPNLAFSMTFQAWKMKFLNFITFQVFHDLYEKKKPQNHFEDPEYQVKILLNGYINDFTLKSKNYI